ncbi:MAG: glycosyltransferase family 4 protein [Gemmatimonadota bacterium]
MRPEMRVLHVVTAFPRHPDDVITPWLWQTLRALRREGVACEVLAPAYRGNGREAAGDLPVHRFRYASPARLETLTHDETTPDRLGRNPAYALLLPGYVAAGCLAAARLQRRRGYDAVHVHWAVPHGLMGLAARAAGARALVTTFYGAELRWAESRFPPARSFLKVYCRGGTLVAISSDTARWLARYTARPVHVVPYPSALPDVAPGRVGRGGDATVLFVGRLVARKGVANLLRAAALPGRSFRVEVVGFGPEERPLRALATELRLGDRVEFAGRVSAADLARRYAAAEVFALPATVDARGDTEGLGVVLLEALAHGVPVVATRRGGISDIVQDGETGLLVEDDEPRSLRAAIERLLEDPALARRLAEAGAERVRREFSAQAVAARLAAVYRDAAGARGEDPARAGAVAAGPAARGSGR